MAENIGYLQSDSSKNGDEQYTPRYAVSPLLEFIPSNKIIWCPFDKEWSAFVSVLENNGNKVIYSHIDYGQNFFDYEPQKWDILVSNPPFSKKDAVLRRAYELNKPFALLLPANSIQGKTRFEIFKNDVQMLCFDQRIDFMNPKHMDSPVHTFAVVCFQLDLNCADWTKEYITSLLRSNRHSRIGKKNR